MPRGRSDTREGPLPAAQPHAQQILSAVDRAEHGNSPRTAPSRGRPYKSGTLRPNQLVLRGRGRARALMGAKNRLAPTKASDEERARGPARASNSRRIRCREAVDGTERVVLFESRDEGGESRL